jgi:hypothetical protein
MRGGEGECGQIGMKSPFNAGPQNLYRDRPLPGGGGDAGPMDLGDRGRGNRRTEACEQRFDRLVE